MIERNRRLGRERKRGKAADRVGDSDNESLVRRFLFENRENTVVVAFQAALFPDRLEGMAHRALDRTGRGVADIGDIRIDNFRDADLDLSDQIFDCSVAEVMETHRTGVHTDFLEIRQKIDVDLRGDACDFLRGESFLLAVIRLWKHGFDTLPSLYIGIILSFSTYPV